MRMLRARLLEEEERKRAEELAAERGEQKAAEWGSQIRSYTLHPSTRVKDHRTGYEVGDANRVLDGDLDGFVREYLLSAAQRSSLARAERPDRRSGVLATLVVAGRRAPRSRAATCSRGRSSCRRPTSRTTSRRTPVGHCRPRVGALRRAGSSAGLERQFARFDPACDHRAVIAYSYLQITRGLLADLRGPRAGRAGHSPALDWSHLITNFSNRYFRAFHRCDPRPTT